MSEQGMEIWISSHEIELIYEIGSSTTGFKVGAVEVMIKDVYFFWGIKEFNAQNKGCPIMIYLSETFIVYNKIKLLI